jgi:thioesterase domain-containing protein
MVAVHQPSLLVMQAGDATPPFFIVYPHISRDLVRHLGSRLPVYGLLGLELDGRQALNRRIEDRAAYYLGVIRSVQREGPYFLGGRCMGGLVAFEMAQQLRAEGQAVALLALFDTPAPRPHCYQSVKENGIAKWFWKMALESYTGLESLLPAAVQAADIRIANRQAFMNYVSRVYPGRITYFWARETHGGASDGRRSAWEQLAGGGLAFHEVTGARDTMMREPHAKSLAGTLTACLHEAAQQKAISTTTSGC